MWRRSPIGRRLQGRRIARLEERLERADTQLAAIEAAATKEQLATAAKPPKVVHPARIIGTLLAAVAVAAAIAVIVLTGSKSQEPIAGPSAYAAAHANDAAAVAGEAFFSKGGTSFDTEYFWASMPPGWANLSADERGWTTGSIDDNRIQVRYEVSASGAEEDPMSLAAAARRRAARRPGYREIELRRADYNGQDAVRWQYLSSEEDGRSRAIAVFFISKAGNGYAIVERAPVEKFAELIGTFQYLRNSFQPRFVDQ